MRRWLCPAETGPDYAGLCPWFGLSPSDLLGQRPHEGIAQRWKRNVTAGHSHRQTSGGKADAELAGDLGGKAPTLESQAGLKIVLFPT